MRALNVHGWSVYSDAADVLAAEVPGIIANTSISIHMGTQVKFAWQIPSPNGSPISAYKIEVQDSTGTYIEETTTCSGSVDPTITLNAACYVPMATFAAAPFNLPHNAPIVFRVSA